MLNNFQESASETEEPSERKEMQQKEKDKVINVKTLSLKLKKGILQEIEKTKADRF